jgi:hydroxyacylglutathione hydrolase
VAAHGNDLPYIEGLIMLKQSTALLACLIVSLSFMVAASMPVAYAADAQPSAAAQAATAKPAIQKTVLTGAFRLTPSTTQTPVNIYLVVGREKALVIDTGYPGNIGPEDVKAITPLPFMVVNTHAHPDHSGSNNAFEKVYVHEADLEAAKRYSGNAELIPIEEGHVFDLGGKKLEVIGVPGHTPGSICLLDAQEKMLFSGDTANTQTWMQISNLPLETYRKNMERLLKWKDQFDQLLPGHGGAQPLSFINDLIACADEILAGKVDPSELAAKPAAGGNPAQSGSLHQRDGVAIRYNPNNLREPGK